MADLVVLGVDPGLASAGWGVVRREGGRAVHVAHGALHTPSTEPALARAQTLARELGALLTTHRPHLVALERWVHYGQSDTTQAHTLGLAIGALVAACGAHGVPVVDECRAQDWRVALGLPRDASKAAGQSRVGAILGLPSVPRPQHAADALAVAVVAAARHRGDPRSPWGSARVACWGGQGEVTALVRLADLEVLTTALGTLREGRCAGVDVTVAGVRLLLRAGGV